MQDLKRRIAAIESDVQFIFDYIADTEQTYPTGKYGLVKEHLKQTPRRKQRPHSAPPRGVKLDEFDVLEIRNAHYWFKDYDPIREAAENNKPKLRRKATLEARQAQSQSK